MPYRNLEGYKLLGSFGDVVLAGHIASDGAPEYVTWLVNTEGTGVSGGRYERDWEQAKVDFICRSGLFPCCRPWTRIADAVRNTDNAPP